MSDVQARCCLPAGKGRNAVNRDVLYNNLWNLLWRAEVWMCYMRSDVRDMGGETIKYR